MKKNLLTMISFLMLVGIAFGGSKYCKDNLFTGETLCTTTNGECSIQMRPRFNCVPGNGSACVSYDPDAEEIEGSYQAGRCYPKAGGTFECIGYGEVTYPLYKPLC